MNTFLCFATPSIHIQGSAEAVAQIHCILQALLLHYRQHDLVTEETVQHYVSEEGQALPPRP